MAILYVIANYELCLLTYITDLNLPICAVVILFVFRFLHLNSPRMSVGERFARFDAMYAYCLCQLITYNEPRTVESSS